MAKSKFMYGQQCFQALGLNLSQFLTSVQHLLHFAEFAAVLMGLFEPGVILIQWFTFQCTPCSTICMCHVVFAVLQHGILVLEDSSSWCFLPSTLIAGFLLQGLFLFICNMYSSIYLFMFSSTEPSGSSVIGAQRGFSTRGLQLDCRLGRLVGCSSTLGCDCSCSSCMGPLGTQPPFVMRV